MKKKSSTKQGSLKKIFIKFIRKMGYEVIDQSNLNIEGKTHFYDSVGIGTNNPLSSLHIN